MSPCVLKTRLLANSFSLHAAVSAHSNVAPHSFPRSFHLHFDRLARCYNGWLLPREGRHSPPELNPPSPISPTIRFSLACKTTRAHFFLETSAFLLRGRRASARRSSCRGALAPEAARKRAWSGMMSASDISKEGACACMNTPRNRRVGLITSGSSVRVSDCGGTRRPCLELISEHTARRINSGESECSYLISLVSVRGKQLAVLISG